MRNGSEVRLAAPFPKAKQAHDTLMMEVHRSQAHALAIRARAEMRLAEEYDAAQERGEVSTGGGRPDCVEDRNAVPATAVDLGLRRDEIHAARKLRDAERDRLINLLLFCSFDQESTDDLGLLFHCQVLALSSAKNSLSHPLASFLEFFFGGLCDRSKGHRPYTIWQFICIFA